MKWLIFILALIAALFLTSCKPKISGQIVTNWVKPSEDYRVVNGQLYNIVESKLWVHPADDNAPAANPLGNPWNVVSYSLSVETVGKDKITCGVYRNEYQHETWTGQLGLSDRTYLKSIVIYHYPNPQSLTTGQEINPLCLRVGNYIQDGISYEAYDCGLPATKLVPEIQDTIVQVDGVRLLLIDAKEANDFLKEKKSESDKQCDRIKVDIAKLQSDLNAKQSAYLEATNVASQSYTNDPRYVAAIEKADDAKKTVQMLSKAINYLKSKYGEPPFDSAIPRASQPVSGGFYAGVSQEQRVAWEAEIEDAQRIQSLRIDLATTDSKIDYLSQQIINERNWQIENSLAAVEAAEKKLDAANQSLESLQSPDFYLADFSPTALETSVTDAKGHFMFHNPPKGTMIFAKVKSDETGGQFFWLVDLPPKGQKLLLNENNMFAVLTNLVSR